MTTFTELVAAVVVHSSAVAYSHFGVVLEPSQFQRPQIEKPRAERVIARTPQRRLDKLTDCPEPVTRPSTKAPAVKA